MDHEMNEGQNSNHGHSRGSKKAASNCGTCGATVNELRRGRCWACYSRWQEQRPVGLGASCAICEERRRDNMRLVEVQGRSLPLCHICAAHTAKLDVVPYSIEGLRAALRRDRRNVERREGELEQALPSERRAARRRAGGGSIGALGDDASVYKLGASDLDLDLDLNAEGELAIDESDIVEDVTVIALEPERPVSLVAASESDALAAASPSPSDQAAPEPLLAEAPSSLQADAG